MGGSHIGTGGDRYLMANRPSEGSRATRQALDDPSRENIERYLRVHIDDESSVTDELVDYIHSAHTGSPEFTAARRQSVSLPHDYTPDLAGIQAPVLLIHGRYDRMVAFEVSIAIMNHIADSRVVLLNNCGHWPPFEKPAEWAAQVLAFLRGYLNSAFRSFTHPAVAANVTGRPVRSLRSADPTRFLFPVGSLRPPHPSRARCSAGFATYHCC